MFPNSATTRSICAALFCLLASSAVAQDVFINELHYDNAGTDTGEAIEITAPVGTDLANWSVVLYNGSNGTVYNTLEIPALLDDGTGRAFATISLPSNGLQNGAPDGLALVDADGSTVQFLSYEGSLVAVGGPADGQTSTDIGVSESSSTPIGSSLQLSGTGSVASDFTWQPENTETFGFSNTGQIFEGSTPPPPTVFISEIHYDNAGSDVGEAIEITATAGADLSGWSVVRYNGSNGSSYGEDAIVGVPADDANGLGALVINLPSNGLQNGSPDGLALIDNDLNVVEFLSYEGSFTAMDGPAAGVTSTDIGVSEASSTEIGFSLQLEGCVTTVDELTFVDPQANTFGVVNPGIRLVDDIADCDDTPPPPPVAGALAFINELHYDNDGADVGEAIEIAAETGADLAGWSVALYNGSNGSVYNTLQIPSLVDGGMGWSFATIELPSNGLQNGSPDGLALANAQGDLIQFLSYEGVLVGVGGVADGVESTDIGVAESGSTPIGSSLQVRACVNDAFVWNGPLTSSFGTANDGQSFDNIASCLPSNEPPPPPQTIVVTIPEIQGDGFVSPLAGQTVIVTGVVTGDFQGGDGSDGDLRGFFMQDAGDGNPSTSDGVFVFDNSVPVSVSVGDSIRVTGEVGERFEQTQVTASSIEVLGSADLPTPVTIGFPLSSQADLEAVEGMLVQVLQPMTVTDIFNLNRFGEVLLNASGRQFQFTQQNLPDVAANAAYLQAQATQQLLLDDGLDGNLGGGSIPYPAPALAADNVLRLGDTVTGLIGNIGFAFGSYRLRPTETPAFTAENPRPALPPEIDGRLKIVSFNVENFFNDLDGRGARTDQQLAIQIDKLVAALGGLDADVYGLVELENDSAEGPSSAIAELTAALNSANNTACGMNYQYAAKTVADPSEDEIAVGIIYCGSTVAPAAGTSFAVLNDTVLAEMGMFVRPLFNGNRTNRTPIAATFEELATGETFTVSVNHFKSKGSGGCDSVTPSECAINDGAGAWNALRTDAANALSAWLATHPTGSDDPDVIILGDLNAYASESPLTALAAAGYEDLARRRADSYSYVFRGQSGTLDYALASIDLSPDVKGVAEWHINADESIAFEYTESLANAASPFRISDHDPLLVGVDLDDTIAPEILSCGTPSSGTIAPWNRAVAFTATASDAQDAEPSVTVGEIRCERRFRFFTLPWRSYCRVDAVGDTLTIHRPGGVKNRISWTATATDATGNSASRECSVDVAAEARGRH